MLEEIKHIIGSRCELRSLNNDLVFMGIIHAFNGDALTVEEAGGGIVPPVIYNTEFKLVLHLRENGTSHIVVLYGQISGSTRTFWRLDRLRRFIFAEQRNSFRQKVSIEASSLCVNPIYRPSAPWRERCTITPTTLSDISMGGVRFRSRTQHVTGDYVALMDVTLLPNDPPYLLVCQICWVDRFDPHQFLCGGRIVNLTPKDQDRLCGDIFQLQRLDVQARRSK